MEVRERASESAQMQITGGGRNGWICRDEVVGWRATDGLSKRSNSALHWDWLLASRG